MVYLDTSALVKLYVAEAGSEWTRSLVGENEGRLFTSIVTYPEVFSMLRRSVRERRLSTVRYQEQRRFFLADWKVLHVVSLTAAVLGPAEDLIERHGLRGYDAVQLCSALWIGRPVFGCFDQQLRRAAEGEGLRVAPERV